MHQRRCVLVGEMRNLKQQFPVKRTDACEDAQRPHMHQRRCVLVGEMRNLNRRVMQ